MIYGFFAGKYPLRNFTFFGHCVKMKNIFSLWVIVPSAKEQPQSLLWEYDYSLALANL